MTFHPFLNDGIHPLCFLSFSHDRRPHDCKRKILFCRQLFSPVALDHPLGLEWGRGGPDIRPPSFVPGKPWWLVLNGFAGFKLLCSKHARVFSCKLGSTGVGVTQPSPRFLTLYIFSHKAYQSPKSCRPHFHSHSGRRPRETRNSAYSVPFPPSKSVYLISNPISTVHSPLCLMDSGIRWESGRKIPGGGFGYRVGVGRTTLYLTWVPPP